MKKTQMKNHKQYGFSLIEVLIALTVVALLVAAVIGVGSQLTVKAEASAAETNLQALKTCIQDLAATDGNTESVNTTFVLSSSCANSSVVNGDRLRLANTSAIEVSSLDYSGLGNMDGVQMDFSVQQKTCEKLVSSVIQSFPVVAIESNVIKDVRAAQEESSRAIVSNCKGSGVKTISLAFEM